MEQQLSNVMIDAASLEEASGGSSSSTVPCGHPGTRKHRHQHHHHPNHQYQSHTHENTRGSHLDNNLSNENNVSNDSDQEINHTLNRTRSYSESSSTTTSSTASSTTSSLPATDSAGTTTSTSTTAAALSPHGRLLVQTAHGSMMMMMMPPLLFDATVTAATAPPTTATEALSSSSSSSAFIVAPAVMESPSASSWHIDMDLLDGAEYHHFQASIATSLKEYQQQQQNSGGQHGEQRNHIVLCHWRDAWLESINQDYTEVLLWQQQQLQQGCGGGGGLNASLMAARHVVQEYYQAVATENNNNSNDANSKDLWNDVLQALQEFLIPRLLDSYCHSRRSENATPTHRQPLPPPSPRPPLKATTTVTAATTTTTALYNLTSRDTAKLMTWILQDWMDPIRSVLSLLQQPPSAHVSAMVRWEHHVEQLWHHYRHVTVRKQLRELLRQYVLDVQQQLQRMTNTSIADQQHDFVDRSTPGIELRCSWEQFLLILDSQLATTRSSGLPLPYTQAVLHASACEIQQVWQVDLEGVLVRYSMQHQQQGVFTTTTTMSSSPSIQFLCGIVFDATLLADQLQQRMQEYMCLPQQQQQALQQQQQQKQQSTFPGLPDLRIMIHETHTTIQRLRGLADVAGTWMTRQFVLLDLCGGRPKQSGAATTGSKHQQQQQHGGGSSHHGGNSSSSSSSNHGAVVPASTMSAVTNNNISSNSGGDRGGFRCRDLSAVGTTEWYNGRGGSAIIQRVMTKIKLLASTFVTWLEQLTDHHHHHHSSRSLSSTASSSSSTSSLCKELASCSSKVALCRVLKDCWEGFLRAYVEYFVSNYLALVPSHQSAKAAAEALERDYLDLVVFVNGAVFELFLGEGGGFYQETTQINHQLHVQERLARILHASITANLNELDEDSLEEDLIGLFKQLRKCHLSVPGKKFRDNMTATRTALECLFGTGYGPKHEDCRGTVEWLKTVLERVERTVSDEDEDIGLIQDSSTDVYNSDYHHLNSSNRGNHSFGDINNGSGHNQYNNNNKGFANAAVERLDSMRNVMVQSASSRLMDWRNNMTTAWKGTK